MVASLAKRRLAIWCLPLVALLAIPVTGYAQEATITGTVTDSTGLVLPGVTVVALHEDTGNVLETVTDGRGAFRMPARIGSYSVTATLDGFGTITRTGVSVQVGQVATIDIELAPSALQESVTVTGIAPLLETSTSSLGSNISRTQMEELPINGRNWQDLAMLAVGNKVNEVGTNEVASDRAGGSGDAQGNYQVNVDGQQVTYMGGGLGNVNPRWSRDSIAEFEYISNRFDASQGRSAGIQINAVTKSGTNAYRGTFGTYIRDDSLNAADHISNEVLPFNDKQYSFTHGGPIVRDRLHYFANYELEKQAWSTIYTTPFDSFNLTFTEPRKEQKVGGRVDYQINPSFRASVTGAFWKNDQALDQGFQGSSTRHPSFTVHTIRQSEQTQLTLTKVIGNRAVNEFRAGYLHMGNHEESVVPWPNHPAAKSDDITTGAPIITFRGISFGPPGSVPQNIRQGNISMRNDFTLSFDKAGRHDLKLGGDYIRNKYDLLICRECTGIIDARGGPRPSNIEEIFPVWNNPDSWDLDAFNDIARYYRIGIGDFTFDVTRHQIAGWVQDDWQVGSNLTLNLGLRYDVTLNGYGEDFDFEPWVKAGRPYDKNNIGPRVGFAYQATDRTVIRGGWGKYFGWVTDQSAHGTVSWVNIIGVELLNDGRDDFLSNPFNGPQPTFEQVEPQTCWRQLQNTGASQPGCIRRYIGNNLASPDSQDPYSYQASIGFQQQLGETMSFEIDYVWWKNYYRMGLSPEVNQAFDPATGIPYDFNDISKRPFPEWGEIDMRQNTLGDDGKQHTIQAGFTKRFSDNWEASATYSATFDYAKDYPPVPPQVGPDTDYLYDQYPQMRNCTHPISWNADFTEWNCQTPINFAAFGEGLIFSEEWYKTDHQVHRFVFNTVYEFPHQIMLGGVFFYGDQGFETPVSGVDLFGVDQPQISNRVRLDGSVIERNSFNRGDLVRVDLRLTKRFGSGNLSVEPMLEVYNLFDRANYSGYNTNESSSRFGEPDQADGVAFQPRVVQLGVRVRF